MHAPAAAPQTAVPARLVATVIFLTAVAPLRTDMYVPAFPRVSREFGGAVILQLTGWRMTFWTLAALGILMTLCALFVVPESMPPGKRHAGGLGESGRAAKAVLSNRRFVGYVVVASSAFIALFAYVATSAFILQNMNGLSPVEYSVVFAANAGGMTIAALVSARLAGRVPTRRVILIGQIIALAAGIVAPIAGLGGDETAVPMAVLMIGGALLSLFGLLVLARPHSSRPGTPQSPQLERDSLLPATSCSN
ncbi:MFS transporter [Arthrobacter sp. UYEF21]|uniref:MFS transporter n=1 Tax=Arthrobacter sp. UYEF21 TaxID=1756364 RepID=UPI003392533D